MFSAVSGGHGDLDHSNPSRPPPDWVWTLVAGLAGAIGCHPLSGESGLRTSRWLMWVESGHQTECPHRVASGHSFSWREGSPRRQRPGGAIGRRMPPAILPSASSAADIVTP